MLRELFKRLFHNKEEPIPFKQAKGDEGVIVIGHYAEQLVRNPALDDALRRIEAEIFYAWKTSPPKAKEEREHLYYRMEGLAQIKLKLAGMVNNMLLETKKTGQPTGEPTEELWN